MAIRVTPAPQQVRSAVHTHLGGLAQARLFGTPALSAVNPDQLALSTPHQVAVLTAAHVTHSAHWCRSLRLEGWRFLVHGPDDAIAAAHATAEEPDAPVFRQINEGPLVRGTEEAIRWAEQQEPIRAGTFEPILVLAPGLLSNLLLLRNADEAGTDYLVAIPPVFEPLQARTLYPPEDAAAALRSIAARRATRGGQP
ncbi:MAG: hypothetical protein JOZ05_00010 [Acetobacteraceae bacterium]|nr:hypothetical protein [Acetobacteraceae bacterium]